MGNEFGASTMEQGGRCKALTPEKSSGALMLSGKSLIGLGCILQLSRGVDAALDAGISERERKTVLVVEDSDDDLVLFQKAAQEAKCGLSFQYVEDGEKALAYLEGEGEYTDREAHPFPDLVFLDLGLLQLDGFEVLEYIRNRPGCKKLEVIVLSGRDDPVCIAQAMAAGADRFISKPIKAATLQGVAELLGSAVVVS